MKPSDNAHIEGGDAEVSVMATAAREKLNAIRSKDDFNNLEEDALKGIAIFANMEICRRAKLAAADAWTLGGALTNLRKHVPDGKWRQALEILGINKTLANNAERIYDHYDLGGIETFPSINAAVKSLPPKVEEPKMVVEIDGKDVEVEETISPAEKRLIERQELVQTAKFEAERAANAEKALADVSQRLAVYEESEEMERTGGTLGKTAAIQEVQYERDQFANRAGDLERDNEELRKEVSSTKWQLRKAEKQLKTAQSEIVGLKQSLSLRNEEIERLKGLLSV